jgi:hypothetical protein
MVVCEMTGPQATINPNKSAMGMNLRIIVGLLFNPGFDARFKSDRLLFASYDNQSLHVNEADF